MSVQERSTALRHELKRWEKQFATLHDGRKPGRGDIKGNADIASKYKEYDRLRESLSGKITVSTPCQAAKRQKVDESFIHPSETPSRRSSRPLATPSKSRTVQTDENGIIGQSPSATPSRTYPTFVGPTPQKDGIPLGLFDLLSPHQASPSSKANSNRPPLSSLSTNIPATPSKRPHSAVGDEEAPDTVSHARFTRTPTSTGKRFLLDTIVTPLKRERNAEEGGTPSSSTKHLRTPAFLRRDSVRLDVLPEGNEGFGGQQTAASGEPVFKRRKGFGRSLSAMIRGLRKKEDEEFEDEMEVQREMEIEACAGRGNPPTQRVPDTGTASIREEPQVLVEDSQVAMPLGPDRQAETSDEDNDHPELEANGQPRKLWKKRGMKRQTKRINIRPVASKPRPQTTPLLQDGDERDAEVVLDSQPTGLPDAASDDEEHDSGFAGENFEGVSLDGKAAQSPSRPRSLESTAPQDSQGARLDSPKKPRRKVNPQAHANYRRLKIKSKAGQGQGRGRFGRSRR
ncbi:hypothetical protein EV356DRAFT_577936 [Viridothelium virens]|uniref:DNA replication regulator SLD2 n=1 Tax=Viridothelium virens TaxID=1048519 RepID=A0A6A6H567_VIRVR|nr:hypothetical protein EV356DRAFT_577936 [Viridothelium virens]